MTDKPIFSPTIAGELIDRGFTMVNKRRDYQDPSKWVYFFKDTPELRKAYDEILTKKGCDKPAPKQ